MKLKASPGYKSEALIRGPELVVPGLYSEILLDFKKILLDFIKPQLILASVRLC